jgi:hypothetical protein
MRHGPQGRHDAQGRVLELTGRPGRQQRVAVEPRRPLAGRLQSFALLRTREGTGSIGAASPALMNSTRPRTIAR